ncbi:MAG: hypothetical protein ACJ77N_17105 [Chloroflexota bacterium]
MTALIGYIVVAVIAIAAALLVAGPHHAVNRDATFELEEVSGRQVPILGALAAFAVTGVVFLVTQAHNVPDANSTSFTTVVIMFVVAYMGYFSSSVLFANVSHRAENKTFDLAAAQYAGASVSLFSVFLGWFALKPLFETFGLTTMATVTGLLLIGAVVVGYGLLATALYRSGYASACLTVLLAVFALVGAVGYAVVVGVLAPDLRSSEATLFLTVLAFLAGVPAYAAMTLLPIAAHREGLARILADRWHLAIVGYAQGTTVLVVFLLLSVLGLA